MQGISAAIITLNEAHVIRRCLDSVRQVAEEVLIVDGGSTDNTPQLCSEWGARVVTRPFDDFVSQKNFALREARFDWVLCLDADEALSPELEAAILDLRNKTADADAYAFNRLNWYAGRWLRHGGWYPDRKVRLADRRKAAWQGPGVHEKLVSSGKTGFLPGDLLHYAYPTPALHLQKSQKYARLVAEIRFEAGVKPPALKKFLSPVWVFFRMYVAQAGFLDGISGFHAARISALEAYLRYHGLNKRWRAKKTRPLA